MAHTRDLYKTKLCTLYQRGNCPRQTCSFAHGEGELRKVPGAGGVTGRQDGHRNGNFRDKLDRYGSSPYRRRSSSRDGRGGSHKGNFSGRRFSPRDRGRSRSRSAVRRRSSSSYTPSSERRGTKKSRIEAPDTRWLDSPGAHLSDVSLDRYGEDDYHGEMKTSGASPSLSSQRDKIQEQVRQVQLEKDALAEKKEDFEKMLVLHVEEASVLTAKILDLEAKVSSSQEDYKRTSSKVKKLIKLFTRSIRAQEEAKRTQSKLYKTAEEFSIEENRGPVVHADDSDYYNRSGGEQGKPSHLVSAEGVVALHAKKMEMGLSEKLGATENGLAPLKSVPPSKDLGLAERLALAERFKKKRLLAVQEKTRALQQNGGIVRPLLGNDLNLPAPPQVSRSTIGAAAPAERPNRLDMFMSANAGSGRDQQMTAIDVSPSLGRSSVEKVKSRENVRLSVPATGLAAQARELPQDTELDDDHGSKNGYTLGVDQEQRVTLNLMSPSKSYADGPGGEIVGKDLLSNFYK